MLRWLTIARSYDPLPGAPPCPMDAANAVPSLLDLDACRTMERQVAMRVMTDGTEHPAGYLEYAAAFFKWWFRLAEVIQSPLLPTPTDTCSWLCADDVERSLVVPDVRRGAVKLSQMLEVRAGEFEVVSAMSVSRTRTVSTTLQTLRTAEWNVKMHHTLMYGTLLDIYHSGLLGVVQMSVVDSRYQGRLAFEWVKKVIKSPSSESTVLPAWPLVFVHGWQYVVVWRTGHAVCPTFSAAYSAWRDLCLGMGGIIGGRYDVRKCTI